MLLPNASGAALNKNTKKMISFWYDVTPDRDVNAHGERENERERYHNAVHPG